MNCFARIVALGVLAFAMNATVRACAQSRIVLPAFSAGSAIVFGEIHGTVESPAYFLGAVRAATQAFKGELVQAAVTQINPLFEAGHTLTLYMPNGETQRFIKMSQGGSLQFNELGPCGVQ